MTAHTQLFPWQKREAPAIVRLADRYFMFSSACSGWDPNQCKLSVSSSLQSGWSELANVGNAIAYDTQAAAILEIRGTKQTTYLYVGDRWQDPDLPRTKTIIFPISFSDSTSPSIPTSADLTTSLLTSTLTVRCNSHAQNGVV